MKSHEEFSLKVWPNKKRRRVEKYIRWKFRGPESGEVNGLLLSTENGKVTGQLGLIPVKLVSKGKIYDAQWACDLMVDPELRKKGTGRKLFEAGISRDMITLGNNPSPKAEKLMLDTGFKMIESGRVMVFPLKAEHLMKWIIPGQFSFTVPLLIKILQPYFNYKKDKIIEINNDFSNCGWNDVLNLIDKKQSDENNLRILHDEIFMKWRGDGIQDYSVPVKALISRNGSYALHSEFLPYYQIYEWNSVNSDDLNNILSVIMKYAGDKKASTIQIVANNETEEKWLASKGFIRSRNKERILLYSNEKFTEVNTKFYFTLYDTDLNL